MTNTYRIRAVAPDRYIVERPHLIFFWRAALYEQIHSYSGWSIKIVTEFSSVDKAQSALDAHIEKVDAIEAHVSQVPIYVTYASKDQTS